jgi:hypothetical protein
MVIGRRVEVVWPLVSSLQPQHGLDVLTYLLMLPVCSLLLEVCDDDKREFVLFVAAFPYVPSFDLDIHENTYQR